MFTKHGDCNATAVSNSYADATKHDWSGSTCSDAGRWARNGTTQLLCRRPEMHEIKSAT